MHGSGSSVSVNVKLCLVAFLVSVELDARMTKALTGVFICLLCSTNGKNIGF